MEETVITVPMSCKTANMIGHITLYFIAGILLSVVGLIVGYCLNYWVYAPNDGIGGKDMALFMAAYIFGSSVGLIPIACNIKLQCVKEQTP